MRACLNALYASLRRPLVMLALLLGLGCTVGAMYFGLSLVPFRRTCRSPTAIDRLKRNEIARGARLFEMEHGFRPADVGELVTASYVERFAAYDRWEHSFRLSYRGKGDQNGTLDVSGAGPDGVWGTADDVHYADD